MDLRGFTTGAINAINRFETVAVSVSTGYAIAGDGSTLPSYAAYPMSADVQALGYRDLLQIQGMNIQGTRRKLYFNGEVDAIVRELNAGGSLITRSDATVWKVAYVLEQWATWCAVVITLQDGS